MTKGKRTFRLLTSDDVCQIYKLLNEKGLVSFPVTEEAKEKLESLISSVSGSYYGKDAYENNTEKAVACLYFLIKDHPFTDGNKRTAILSFEVLCDLNNLIPKYEGFELDELAVFIEQTKPVDHHLFIKQLAELFFAKKS